MKSGSNITDETTARNTFTYERNLLTLKQSIIIGSLTGFFETGINLPLWTIKTRAQCNLPFTLNPFVLYRGYIPSAMTMSAFMGIQMVNSSLTEHGMVSNENHVSSGQRIFSAFIGGMMPSVIFGPLDLVITQYHKHNYASYSDAFRKTISRLGYRGMFAGLPATALTDGNFACCYWGVFPYLKSYFIEKNQSNSKSTVYSGLLTGIFATIFAHPIDMVKTMQQKLVDEVDKEKRWKENSMKKRFDELRHHKHGVGFFKGIAHRGVWLTSSITTAGLISNKIESYTFAQEIKPAGPKGNP